MSDFPKQDGDWTEYAGSYYTAIAPKKGKGYIFTQEETNFMRELIRQVLVENGLIQPAAEEQLRKK